MPPDFGDLIILYRDANGVPILDGNQCQQPIAFPSGTCTWDCTGADPCLVPVDPATCAVEVAYATCTQEVDFGRINEARAPDTVFESQLEDVVVNLATADCVSLGPAGRLVTSRVAGPEVSTSAIDSPLQNLAIYRQLMLVGFLGAETSPITLPAGALDTAARGLGVASDKAGEVNVDLVAYLNQIMGLSDPATTTVLDPKICIDVKEEVMGVVQLVQKCFLDYGAYGYDRTANFGALPAPAYMPEFAPTDGWFEYLAEVDPPVNPPLFEILQGPILDAVFGVHPGFLDGNIGGFAQAADDARAVIDFMHTNPVPGDFLTAVPCAASGDITYDVSISEVSGLQVPVRMVAGTEGREFTVTVNNESSSPDPATGTVTVTAVDANGASIDTFPRVFTFTDLLPGQSASWTELFSIDLKTTVTWTATAEAEFDVNPGNNSVSETTTVIGGGGGGSGGGGPGGGGPGGGGPGGGGGPRN
jgi:uncharacterized membrane protein YgcG